LSVGESVVGQASDRTLQMDDACQALMKTAMRQLQLTMRAYHRELIWSQANLNLAGPEMFTYLHLSDVPQYPAKDWVAL